MLGFIHPATLIGLLLGTLGRYGLALDQGALITRKQVVGQVLMLGICGLLAETGVDGVALAVPGADHDNVRAFVAAGVALIASKAVARFAKSAEAEVDKRLPVPSSNPEPRP